MGRNRSNDDSIENEPQFQRRFYDEQPIEEPLRALQDSEIAENSVWDEPNIKEAQPHDAVTYRSMLQQRMASITSIQSWGLTLLVAIVAGPLAIIGTFASHQGATGIAAGLLVPVLIAPLIEEIMKNASALWVAETHPHWFRSPVQIAICVLASGAAFAVVENFLYLHVYEPNPSPSLVQWRWTVCVALHMGCAFVAGLGTVRIWKTTVTQGTLPQLALGAPYMIAAMVIHGSYNAMAVLLELFAHPF
ncbi:MAG: PrsW family intramembrane metalloprotease [Planctomycetales bacterium]|nr:PrsW family intramembrane metalloprotease [Planctomycetales bacterium]